MIRFEKGIGPLDKRVDYIGTAHGISSKEVQKEVKELKNKGEITIDPPKDVWRCPYCGNVLKRTDCTFETYQCDECGLAWRIIDVHPMTDDDEYIREKFYNED